MAEPPIRRSPGRPRKVVPDQSTVDAGDERIGQEVADRRWESISFPDGGQYRCKNGRIVEKLN